VVVVSGAGVGVNVTVVPKKNAVEVVPGAGAMPGIGVGGGSSKVHSMQVMHTGHSHF